jgi:hypothetical protein
MSEILQLKITLRETSPVIRREILMESNSTFLELHMAIQLAMGWRNDHLFNFRLEGIIIEVPTEESKYFDAILPEEEEKLDASKTILSEYLNQLGQRIIYHYDFGDDWEHEVIVERILPKEKWITYPVCIDGEMNCPPENSGGTYGFYQKLEIIKDKQHPDYKEIREWLSKDYDVDYFDLESANKRLLKIDRYLKEMLE